jgi:hypothetical protein
MARVVGAGATAAVTTSGAAGSGRAALTDAEGPRAQPVASAAASASAIALRREGTVMGVLQWVARDVRGIAA